MSSSPIIALLRFSIGVSRVGIRHGSHIKQYKKPEPEKAGFWPGHGEQIWIFNHIMTNQVIYSYKSVLDSNRALRQLPFNGKKTKPAKLRKDYWRPMAMIKFPEGAGKIGRSAYQKLREFRRSHELEWGHQTEELYRMSRKERGVALNDQKANAVADMAAVLGGAGRGNLIKSTAAEDGGAVEQGKDAAPAPTSTSTAGLTPATIYWVNALDQTFASTWPENVTHEIGLYPEDHKRAIVPDVSEETPTAGQEVSTA